MCALAIGSSFTNATAIWSRCGQGSVPTLGGFGARRRHGFQMRSHLKRGLRVDTHIFDSEGGFSPGAGDATTPLAYAPSSRASSTGDLTPRTYSHPMITESSHLLGVELSETVEHGSKRPSSSTSLHIDDDDDGYSRLMGTAKQTAAQNTLPVLCSVRNAVLLVLMGTLALILCLIVGSLRALIHDNGSSPTIIHVTRSPPTSVPTPTQTVKQPWGLMKRPLVIAHRGMSAVYPEHTRAAYMAAIEAGADVIECDVVLTRDLVGICRHEPNLIKTTDVMQKFGSRTATYDMDGVNVTGVFAADLTLEEVRQLRAVQPWPFRDQSYNGKFPLVTLDEYLDIALSANRTVAVYPETKNPAFHNSRPEVVAANTSIEQVLLTALQAHGYKGPINSPEWKSRPVYIQSFDYRSIKDMSAQTCMPLIQLLGVTLDEVQPDGRTVRQMLEPRSIRDLSKMVVGVGPGKDLLVKWQPPAKAGGQGVYTSSGVVQKMHDAGLQVHTYTLRDEPQFILPHISPNTTRELELLLVQLGVDGVFADQPMTPLKFINDNDAIVQASRNLTLLNAQRPCAVAAAG